MADDGGPEDAEAPDVPSGSPRSRKLVVAKYGCEACGKMSTKFSHNQRACDTPACQAKVREMPKTAAPVIKRTSVKASAERKVRPRQGGRERPV